MKKLVIFSILLSCSNAMEDTPQEIFTKMISNGVRCVLELYHGNDWYELNAQANEYWRDPTPVLTENLTRKTNHLKTFLTETFLENDSAIKRVLSKYITNQCESLYADYQRNKDSTYSYFRSFPTQYTTTLVYESKAIELGIRLNQNYHQLYNLSTHQDDFRTRIIEEMNHKIPPIPQGTETIKSPTLKKAPPPPPGAMKPLAKGYAPKNIKKSPSLPIIPDSVRGYLNDIKKGSFKLRHIDPETLQKYTDPESLPEILKRGLKSINSGVHGKEDLLPDRDNEW